MRLFATKFLRCSRLQMSDSNISWSHARRLTVHEHSSTCFSGEDTEMRCTVIPLIDAPYTSFASLEVFGGIPPKIIPFSHFSCSDHTSSISAVIVTRSSIERENLSHERTCTPKQSVRATNSNLPSLFELLWSFMWSNPCGATNFSRKAPCGWFA